jgi:predicted phage terminase large subunit-like protein
MKCLACNGSGKIVLFTTSNPCKLCGGTGEIPESNALTAIPTPASAPTPETTSPPAPAPAPEKQSQGAPLTLKQIREMPAADRQQLIVQQAAKLLELTVFKNPYLSWMTPSPQQAYFMIVPVKEALLGGQAGGGKSSGLLAAALQYVMCPGYSALLLRRSFTDLTLPGSLIPLSHEWLTKTPWMRKNARWNGADFKWTFSSGAVLQFGYINNATDKYRYQSSNFLYVGYDELTQFPEDDYLYLFSRLRKSTTTNIPLRMRAATNPGGIGHDWVKRRFLEVRVPDRVFVPSRLEDNKYLDKESYESSLAMLDPVTRAQLRHGDWNIRPEGNMFKRKWFKIIPRCPALKKRVRGWDLAGTEETQGKDPDYTVGVGGGKGFDGNYYVTNVTRKRLSALGVESLVKGTAMVDGYDCAIRIERELGSSGKSVEDRYVREILAGFNVRFKPSTGDKVTRAMPASAACENGLIYLVEGEWIDEFLDEVGAFPPPGHGHDDQVDAFVTFFEALNVATEIEIEVGGGVCFSH